MLKSFLKFSFVAVFFASTLISCDKEPAKPKKDKDKNGLVEKITSRSMEGGSSDDVECYNLVFPIEINVPQKGRLTVASDDELLKEVMTYYGDDFEKEEDVTFVFPVYVANPSGDQKKVDSEDQLYEAYDACLGEDNIDYADCYELIYPLTVMDDEGNKKTINKEEDFDDFYEFVYPLSIKLKDGTTKVLNNETEHDAVYDSCD